MLFPAISCSFDSTVNNISKLKNSCTRDKERVCPGFGEWVTTPRKRKSKSKDDKYSDASQTKVKADRNSLKLMHKTDTYYKRYRVDPLEGTFKHYANHAQYIKLYRETTTLCYKQRTLQELSSMYSAALDINSEKGHTLSGCYNLDLDSCGHRHWDLVHPVQYPPTTHEMMYVKDNQQIPPITSRSESGIPLMLLPTAPSIPTRLNQSCGNSQIAQAAFMCNAYLNKNTVCPVHRLIHRRDTILSNRCRNNLLTNAMEHIKVELPGIPKRRYNIQIKRLQTMRESHPILGSTDQSVESSSQKGKDVEVKGPPTSKGNTPHPHPRTPLLDEEEDSPDIRLSNLLSSNNHSSPSERINKALSQHKRLVPSMHLPVTALLQYTPNHITSSNRQVKMKKLLRSKLGGQKKNKQQTETVKPRPDVRQVNYEQQYEKFFTDVLESKGKTSQRKHFQNLANKP